MQKIIISGITGQDGYYMSKYLLDKGGYEVLGGIRRTSQVIDQNLKEQLSNSNFQLVPLDLNDVHSITSLIKNEKPDFFINLGASTFVADSWNNPDAYFRTNCLSLIHILEAVRHFAPNCRVYSAGSSEQFGNVDYSPQNIEHPNKPRSIYGASKASAGMICKIYRESYGLYVVHGLLYNHESRLRQNYFVTRKITQGVARIKKTLELNQSFEPLVLGNINTKRDWSFAGDFMDGIWRMLNQEIYRKDEGKPLTSIDYWGLHPIHGAKLETIQSAATRTEKEYRDYLVSKIKEYILASGETHSIREFIETAFEVAGIPIIDTNKDRIDLCVDSTNKSKGQQINYTDTLGRPLVVVSREFYRPAEVDILQGDSSPARTELGWEPKISFKQLVREMVEADIARLG